jgi:hypothetical protein
MRVIAVIDDPKVVEKILRHRGAWHETASTGGPGPYIYEPCDDVDPTPDYENVLTDRASISPSPLVAGGACPATAVCTPFPCQFGPANARTFNSRTTKPEIAKHHSRITCGQAGLPAGSIAPCLVSPKTNSPSPAQRSVRAGAQKANSYQ